MTRRSRVDTSYDILKVIARNREIRPTHILYEANLTWNILAEILKFMKAQGFIQTRVEGMREWISLTPKGLGVLQKLEETYSALLPEALAGGTLLRLTPDASASLA